ncbi:MAG: hypothetical protein J6Y31_03310 [Bacteroidales bacterium]|nr:hypothetical protein [Bacteroidales bacterium]
MKKLIIIAAAIAACVACAKSEKASPDVLIKFQVADYKAQTKAGEVSLLADTDHFTCKAFLHAEGIATTQDFFGTDGETITYNGTNAWEPSHPYYWPKGEQSYINFVSYFDTGAGPTTVTETSLEWAARTIGTGDNIMYADEAWHFKANNNPASYGKDGVTEGVPTLFHHALAQIVIKTYATKLEDTNATWEITIEDIELGDIYNKGTLSLTNTDPNTKDVVAWTGSWVTDTSVNGNLTPADKTIIATAKASADVILANQSVLPQSLTGVTLDFKVRIVTTYKVGGNSNEELITKSVSLPDAAGFNTAAWAMNTKYAYYIKIDPVTNEVLFDPAVAEDWIDGGEAEYEY